VTVAIFSALVTAVLLFGIKLFIPLRVSAEDEETGLDSATHGESAYHM
jgi:Amt family ammonium transporter